MFYIVANFQTPSYNTFWDMNFFLVGLFVKWQTEKPCIRAHRALAQVGSKICFDEIKHKGYLGGMMPKNNPPPPLLVRSVPLFSIGRARQTQWWGAKINVWFISNLFKSHWLQNWHFRPSLPNGKLNLKIYDVPMLFMGGKCTFAIHIRAVPLKNPRAGRTPPLKKIWGRGGLSKK